MAYRKEKIALLTLAILGFLNERPMHAYELKGHIAGLTGHVRPVSDGALYPAIKRLRTAGLLTSETVPGSGAAPKHVLSLTDAGRAELARRLREPQEVEITDRNSFYVLLTFIGALHDPAEEARLLRRRLEFLDGAASYFYRDGKPLRSKDIEDRYRRGMLRIASATRKSEREWLRETLDDLAAAE
ncbi:PadR family transcriptional regulator [Amycolatopsis sp. NPDC021455]|uniref:PadR family transcriptional regulator n=1 Tax=Amycolatopsis sp. NPDC021455 TaxID=3154901 RepID=UPI0033DE4511